MALSAADKRALRTGISVGIAVAAYGVSFGALSVAAGLDVWQTCFLSLVLFSGGSQFAVIGIIASGGAAARRTSSTTGAGAGARGWRPTTVR